MGIKKISLSFIKPRHLELIRLIKESWLTLFLATICLLVVAGTTAVSAYLIKPALDDVFISKDGRMLKLIPIAVIIVYFLRGLGIYGQEYLMSHVGQNIIRRLRNRLYNHIQDLPLSFFQKEKTGALMSRITNDVNTVKSMVSSVVTGSIRDLFTIIGLTFVIFYQIWQLALFAFLILPVAFYPIAALGKRVRRVSRKCLEAIADMSSFLHETFAGNKIVKAFGMEAYEKKRFYDKTLKLFNLEMKEVRAKALSSPIMEFLGGMGIAFVIWYGGSRVISGIYTTGTFVSFLAAVVMLYDPVKKLSKLNNHLQEGLAATDRIFDIIETKSDIKEDENPVVLRRGPHNVTFDNVSFRYKDVTVLKNINLEVKSGEILALVGMSGGGKTSLVNLIPRFYDVSSGSIYIDGIDLRKASVSSLRDQIAIVTQEPILFNDTVRNNIAYGSWNASEKDIEMAARAAYAYDFIQGFPDKFDTILGELGGRLSGGEKQRICIARALIKDAPILILDEATSSLDTESERLVQKALENLMKGRTTFVIAHRLSTIGYANRIIVIIDGRIVEEGRHEELMAKEGEYCKLYQMQFGAGDTK
ncbi:MAG: lipid A export permease/ATP-binding protein MsbA [Desulfobacterales bacterium]|nr:lipid A export permease/ATP-binding protein MsbA [Desulfobacterales bacterium]